MIDNKQPKKQTVAQYVVEFLKYEGVQYVFGIPGGQPLSICDAIYDQEDMEFIAPHHENAAAHAADAMGRLTGTPGVCLATTGPGATNLLTGIGGAKRDSSPVIAITANNNKKDILRDDAQDADHNALFRSLTKWTVQINDPEHVHEIMSEAFQTALSGNPGPVHIDFTRDVLQKDMPEKYQVYRNTINRKIPGDVEQLNKIIDIIDNYERPVIWAGNGVKLSQARKELLNLAELLNIPIITTFNGIGAVPTTHDLVFGTRSRMGTMLCDEIISDSDVMLAIGNSLNGPSTSRWKMKIPNKLIQIDIDPTIIGKHYPETLGVWGDAKECLKYIINNSKTTEMKQVNRKKRIEQLKEKYKKWKETRVNVPEYRKESPIKPQSLIETIGNIAPNNTVFSVDAGNPGIWTHLLSIKENNLYMKPVGFGNMAFSLPGAIAAKLTYPERPVICIVGDGSLGMSLAEIETAVRLKLSIVLIVMNDKGYGNIKQEQLRDFGPRYIGVDFTDISFTDIAIACNAKGERVNNNAGFESALQRALSSNSLYLIDALIDQKESVWDKPF